MSLGLQMILFNQRGRKKLQLVIYDGPYINLHGQNTRTREK